MLLKLIKKKACNLYQISKQVRVISKTLLILVTMLLRCLYINK
jgi:hypothetical protein